MTPDWRQAAASMLTTRAAAVVELLLVVAITLGHRALRSIPVDETLPIFVLAWFSLWLRGVGWKGVGLSRPGNWARVVMIGVCSGVLLQVLSEFVTEPAIRHFTHQAADMSEFVPLVGNLKLALVYFLIVWSWVAFGEELAVGALFAAGAGVLIERGTRQAALFAGGALVLVGLPLVALARRQHGAAFAFTPQAKGLVTDGLYSRIPHPMYVFLDLALLGGIVMLRQAWLLGVWAALVIVQVLQVRREAKILENVFGDAYREYRRRTWW